MTNNNNSSDFEVLSPMNKSTFDEGLKSIIMDVMNLPLDNPIPLAIHHAGVSTWNQFVYMDEDDIYQATYVDGNGTTQTLTKYEEKLLQWLIGYVRENIDADTEGSDLPSFYTQEGFQAYTQKRRKVHRFKARYSGTFAEKSHEKRKSLDDHIVVLCAKLKKMTSELLEKRKEQQKKDKASTAAETNETDETPSAPESAEEARKKKSLDDHVVELCAKVTKTANEILEKYKEQKKKDKATAAATNENPAAEPTEPKQ
jgi:hypothetical protein